MQSLEVVKQLFEFMVEKKKWWLFPLVAMILLVGVLIVVSQSSAISPFIYAMI